MYVIKFSSLRLHEHGDPVQFRQHAEPWLVQREAENHFMLELMGPLAGEFQRTGVSSARFFTVQDGDNVVAALVVEREKAHVTWASVEMLPVIVDGLFGAGHRINAVYGPGHVALFLAREWVRRAGGRVDVERSIRVYQIARLTHVSSPGGRLVVAGEADLPVVDDWFAGLSRETGLSDSGALARRLMGESCLYLWHEPGPCAMGAFISSTPNGGSIRHVYVPPALREGGYGKHVIAGLAGKALGAGRRFCFFEADPADHDTDQMLVEVGARTICEYAQCRILPGG